MWKRKPHRELSAEAKERIHTRKMTALWVKRGIIKKTHCKVCGDPRSQAHHDNYDNARLVHWLCRDCHRAVHRGVLIVHHNPLETTCV